MILLVKCTCTLLALLSATLFFEMASAQNDIRFQQEIVYAETGDVLFGNILTAAVDPQGRIYLGDNDQSQVHVLNADGSYITSIGGRGSGPGEFQMISKVMADKNHVHIFDLIQAHVHVYDTERFRFVRTIALTENGGFQQRSGRGRPFDMHLLPDGTYLVSYRNFMDSSSRQVVVISSTGEILDDNRYEFSEVRDENVIQQSSGNTVVVANLPFSRTSRVVVSSNGLLYSNWSGELSFEMFDASGRRTGQFSHPFTNAPLNRDEVMKMLEDRGGTRVTFGSGGGGGGGAPGGTPQISRMMQNMEMPDTWPAVSSLYADSDDRLWVATFTENTAERKWYLFESSGELLGTFTWPAGKTVVHAGNGSVWVLHRDPEELDHVVRYRVQL
jgi:hypothetical protein